MLALPPACTSSFQEHSVRKQLINCYDIADGHNQGRADLAQWQTSHVFRSYLSTLSEDLEALKHVPAMQAEVLELYQRELNSLSQRRAQAAAQASASQASQRAAAQESANRRSLFADLKTSATSEAPQLKSPPRQLTAAEHKTLETNADLQEYATDEMVGMVAVLKGNSLAMEEQLRRRGRLLDETEDAMNHSLHHSRVAKVKATEVKSMQRVGFCKTCMSLLMVGCVFVGVYLYIRVTYMVGFKQ